MRKPTIPKQSKDSETQWERERERESKALKITQKASISKKVADDAAVEVSVPECTTITSGDDLVWADLSPLPESAC